MSEPFVLSVNYWPRRKAIHWWSEFDPGATPATEVVLLAQVRFLSGPAPLTLRELARLLPALPVPSLDSAAPKVLLLGIASCKPP